MLWFPVGYTVGYVVLLVLVAAPLRRSGAYTLPGLRRGPAGEHGDPAALLGARRRDRLALPAPAAAGRGPGPEHGHRGADLGRRPHRRRRRGGQRRRRRDALDHPGPGGAVLGQAHRDRRAGVRPARRVGGRRRARPGHRPGATVGGAARTGWPARDTRSTRPTACCSPSPSARWGCRTSSSASTPTPTARAARRTTLTVVALLGAFYLFPPLYGVLGRVYLPDLPQGAAADTLVLRLPVRDGRRRRRRGAVGGARRWRLRGLPLDGLRA